MKNILLILVFIATANLSNAQNKGQFIDYENTFYKEIETALDGQTSMKSRKVFKLDPNSIKNYPKSPDEFTKTWCQEPTSQGRTGTCWCFSTSSFYESEIARKTGQQVDISELYTVYWEYVEKAKEFIKTKGGSFFGEGSETNAVARMMEKYGLVPQEVYSGKNTDLAYHDHQGMYDTMHRYLKDCKTNNQWDQNLILDSIKKTLNAHLGVPPEKFQWNKKTYSPTAWMKEMQLVPSHYINFMSLMEVPYNQKAVYDVPDNWWKSDNYYNVPLDDFVMAFRDAVKGGYSISLGGDVSEAGMLAYNDLAFVPSFDIPSEAIDENARQFRFSNNSTTDDHAIHVVGYTEKDNGYWYLIKDSGSSSQMGNYKGYYFMHEDYVKLKMMTFTVHQDAVKKYTDKTIN